MEDVGQVPTAAVLKEQEMEGIFRMQKRVGAVRAEKSRAWGAFPEGFLVEPRKQK